MKKITILLFMLFFCVSLMAQKAIPTNHYGLQEKNIKEFTSKMNHPQSSKTTIDTAGWTSSWVPLFFSPLLEVHTYYMTDANQNREGYWFGTNGTSTSDTASDVWAQCWINSSPVHVSGVLFLLSGKNNLSSSPNSKINFYIQKVLPYVAGAHGCIIQVTPNVAFGPSPAGPSLASGSMNINTLDTSFLSFNYVPMTVTSAITGDFAAVADFKAIRTHGDTAYMFCDGITNGLGLDYAQTCIDTASYYYVSTNLSTLDVNISMWAVIDDNSVGINDPGYFNGLKMTIRQNPVKENVFIDYALQNNGSVKLTVYDLKGNEVAAVNNEGQTAGQHSININISKLKSGMYFCTLTANGGRITKKLIIE